MTQNYRILNCEFMCFPFPKGNILPFRNANPLFIIMTASYRIVRCETLFAYEYLWLFLFGFYLVPYKGADRIVLNRIFISHGIHYSAAYYTVEKWLNEAMKTAGGFSWVNCSGPDGSESDNSDDSADKMLFMNEIRNQISDSSIFIAITDMYYENKKLMDFEIAAAKHYGKYIIGLKSWRNLKPVPKSILKSADEIVNLRGPDLINSINMHCKINDPVSG